MLLDYKLPAALVKESTPRSLDIYLDTIYEQANEDFFKKTIMPALLASRRLIVVHTPNALKAQKDGSANWLVREIEFFRTLPQRENISIALAKGNGAELPAKLHIYFPNIEIVDLRRLGLLNGREVRDRLLVFIATLYDIPPKRMPDLRQEERRRKQRHLKIIASSLIMVSLAATGLLGWFTYENRWFPMIVRSHWMRGDHGHVKIEPMKGGRSVLTGTFPDGPYARLWDAATGRILRTITGEGLGLLPKRRFLLVTNPGKNIYAFDLIYDKIYGTPFKGKANALKPAPWELFYGSSGKILLQVGNVDGLSGSGRLSSIVVWSLISGKVGRVDGFLSGGDWLFEASDDGKRLIANQFEPHNFQPKLWDVETGTPIASLVTAGKNAETDFKINNHLSLIVTRTPLNISGTKQQFALWNLADGAPTGISVVHDMGDSPVSSIIKMDLSKTGSWVFRGGGQEVFEPIELVDGKTLRPLADLRGKALGRWLEERLLLLDEEGNASMWDTEVEQQIKIPGIDFKTMMSVAVSGDRTRAALMRRTGRVELWNLQRRKKVGELRLYSQPRIVRGSIDGRFFLVTVVNGKAGVFSFRNWMQFAELSDAAFGNDWEAYIDMSCQRINIWTEDGQVIGYREQLYMFGIPWATSNPCS
ncbi:MAG TPA: hypothetical protein VF756_30700 [Thermoanaerobaculia bacterium]